MLRKSAFNCDGILFLDYKKAFTFVNALYHLLKIKIRITKLLRSNAEVVREINTNFAGGEEVQGHSPLPKREVRTGIRVCEWGDSTISTDPPEQTE